MPIDIAELFKATFTATKLLGRKTFPDLVYTSVQKQVIKLDPNDAHDKLLVDLIVKTMKNFVVATQRQQLRFRGNRANDVGKRMEEAIVEEMKKTKLKPNKLGASGYPDLEIDLDGKITYLELKTSSQKKLKDTHYRLFYFTSGKKIKHDAHHLMLQIQITEESPKIWVVDSWQLRDLHDLQLGLKAEWNTNQQGIDACGTISQG